MGSCALGAREVDDDLEHIGVLLPLFISCFVPFFQRRAIVSWSLDICRIDLQFLSDDMPASMGKRQS